MPPFKSLDEYPLSSLLFWYERCLRRSLNNEVRFMNMNALGVAGAMGNKSANALRKKLSKAVEAYGRRDHNSYT